MYLEMLGSPAALSLAAASNPSVIAIAALIAGATALSVVAAIFIYQKIQHYKKEKHEAEIKAVLALWEETLKHIRVPGRVENIGLPAPFQLNADETAYDAMHFTKMQIEAMGDGALREPDDPSIINFKGHVKEAIDKLQQYYNARHDPDGVTILVIQYLLNILDTKVLHFAGYDYDIALINALLKFINGYSYAEKGKHAQRINYLGQVFRLLSYAKQELEKHQKQRTLTDIVNSTLGACRDASNKVIHLLAQVITPLNENDPRHWLQVEKQNLEELQTGIIVSHNATRVIGSFAYNTNPVRMPGNFIELFQQSVAYYEASINTETYAILIPNLKLFEVQNLKEFKQHANFWRGFCDKYQNFLTLEADSHGNYVPIRDIVKIRNRLCIYIDMFVLNLLNCSVQWHFMQLSRFTIKFGTNKAEEAICATFCEKLDELCQKLIHQVGLDENEIINIEKENKNAMMHPLQYNFPLSFRAVFADLKHDMKKTRNELQKIRQHFANTVHPSAEVAEHELLQSMEATIHAFSDHGVLAKIQHSQGGAPEEEDETLSEHPPLVDNGTQTDVHLLPPIPRIIRLPPPPPPRPGFVPPVSVVNIVNILKDTPKQYTADDLKKSYFKNAGFFSMAKYRIFKSGVTREALEKILLERAQKPGHSNGASAKTVREYGIKAIAN